MSQIRLSTLVLSSFISISQAFDLDNIWKGQPFQKNIQFEQSSYNYLPTVTAEIGTPPKKTELLIDLNSEITHYFSRDIEAYLTNVERFYSRSASSTSQLMSETEMFDSKSCGFSLDSYHVADQVCFQLIDNSVKDALKKDKIKPHHQQCIYQEFYDTYLIDKDEWLQSFNLTNIGGILGLGRPAPDSDDQISWLDADISSSNQMTFKMRPNKKDFLWLEEYQLEPKIAAQIHQQDSSPFENLQTNSSAMFGAPSSSFDIKMKSTSSNHWSFTLEGLVFGNGKGESVSLLHGTKNVMINETESFEDEQKNKSEDDDHDLIEGHQAVVSLAFNGIGLPRKSYLSFMETIKEVLPDIQCSQKPTGYCHMHKVTCADVLENGLKGFKLQMIFQQAPDKQIELPIETLMRQQEDKCIILAVHLTQGHSIRQSQIKTNNNNINVQHGSSSSYESSNLNSQTDHLILGTAFLQQFDALFTYESNGDNLLELNLQDNVIPGVQVIELNQMPLGEKAGLGVLIWITLIGMLVGVTVCVGKIKQGIQKAKQRGYGDEFGEFEEFNPINFHTEQQLDDDGHTIKQAEKQESGLVQGRQLNAAANGLHSAVSKKVTLFPYQILY